MIIKNNQKIEGSSNPLPVEILIYCAIVMAVIVGIYTFFSESSKANEIDKIKSEIKAFDYSSKKGEKMSILLTDAKESVYFCTEILIGDETKGLSSVKVNDNSINGVENNTIRKVCIKEREKGLVKIELMK